MGRSRRVYVVVCRGPHCRERGALPLRKRLVALLKGRDDPQLIGYSCFGQCERGPNVAFYPPGEWYGDLAAPDAADRVLKHVQDGQTLTARLTLPDEERTEHLRNIEDLVTTLERDRERRHWWWPF